MTSLPLVHTEEVTHLKLCHGFLPLALALAQAAVIRGQRLGYGTYLE